MDHFARFGRALTSVLATCLLFAAGSTTALAACGDGILDAPLEQCDDGNAADGDCCSSTCTFEADGTACNTSDLCYSTSAATCDGAGTCVAGAICGEPLRITSLSLLDRSDNATERLMWWNRMNGTESGQLGDPAAQTRYAFCLYEPNNPLSLTSAPEGLVRMSLQIAPGLEWRTKGSTLLFKGNRYTPNGIRKIKLRGPTLRSLGFAKLRASSSEGIGLPGPISATYYFEPHFALGLVNDEGLCLVSDFPINDPDLFTENTPTSFRQKGLVLKD